ncbi:Short chain dehydrogenase sor7 [Penicillium odoratum]|uniref:Short chain dehydrogenase sor7 n=1 Tax=Penicillium odoratum TaxID=1167516 RepID=UPI0025495CCB|nr:Short chain dehydrogenase sor7 [Penicillium odoratum]KAJ5758825.1 Short chain dehydrogenase sor7 [Penicillium odoratum]
MAKLIIHETSLAGKTVIITGGNSGLGWEFARQSLILNASRVIITTRSKDKGIAAIEALRADPIVQSSNATGKLELFDLDLDDYQSGIHFTQSVKQEVAELDILLCNGGTNQFRYELSKSGHERIMQVNSYTHFLIVLCLLPLLKATAAKRDSPSRVTFLSSFSHTQHTLEKNTIGEDESILAYHDSKENFHGRRQYQNSKLAINAFAQRLATTISPSEVIVNTPILYLYFKVKGRDPFVGGQILINAVVSGKESHGKYLELDKISRGALFLTRSAGKNYIERLWNEILEESIKANPEVKGIS